MKKISANQEKIRIGAIHSHVLILNSGVRIMIDEVDFHRVSQLSWYVEKNKHAHISIVANQYNKGVRTRFSLAKFILEPPKGSLALMREKSSDELLFDYRRSNLYVGTSQDRNRRRRKLKPKTSQFKGVHFRQRCSKWVARIRVEGKLIWIGTFEDEVRAAIAYNEAAKLYFGEGAFQNQIPE